MTLSSVEPAPNSAVWNVQLTITGGPAAAATGSQGDVFELETPGTQTVTFQPTGVNTAIVTDTTNTSTILLTNTFAIVGLNFVSSPGGVEHVVYQGLAGGDNLTIIGTANNDTTVINPTGTGSGTFTSSLSPAFSFVGETTITVDGGSGGTADSVEIDGTLARLPLLPPPRRLLSVRTGHLGTGARSTIRQHLRWQRLDHPEFDQPDAGQNDQCGQWQRCGRCLRLSRCDNLWRPGDDMLIGSPNVDYIDGGEGDDIIIGGAGDDELLGNTGSDTFTWTTGDGSDRIEGGSGESDSVSMASDVTPMSSGCRKAILAKQRGYTSTTALARRDSNVAGVKKWMSPAPRALTRSLSMTCI